MNKKVVIFALFLMVISVFGMIMTKGVNAKGNSHPPLIQELAERFNLDEGQLKNLFDKQNQDRKPLRQKSFENNLNKAVENFVINEDQKQTILNKINAMQNVSILERKKLQENFQNWLNEEGINSQDLGQYLKIGLRKGFHRMSLKR